MLDMVNAALIRAIVKKMGADADFREKQLPLRGDPDEYLGPTPTQLDRPAEVLDEFQNQYTKGNVRGSRGTIEQEMDQLEKELIEEGVLEFSDTSTERPIPSLGEKKQSNTFTQSVNRQKPKTVFEDTSGYIDPKLAPEATHFQELEQFDKFMSGKKTSPITNKIPQGTPKKEYRGDDIDLVNARREKRLEEYKKQLPPHMQTPENIEILVQDIMEADIADLASGKVFGKDKSKFPKPLDPDKENFSLRNLEDIFTHGKGNEGPSAQKNAVAGFRKRATKAQKASGRTVYPTDRLPTNEKSFANRPRPDASKLEGVQETLTGPQSLESRMKALLEAFFAREKVSKLKAKRLGQ